MIYCIMHFACDSPGQAVAIDRTFDETETLINQFQNQTKNSQHGSGR